MVEIEAEIEVGFQRQRQRFPNIEVYGVTGSGTDNSEGGSGRMIR
jgi:hypothetical protein